MITVQISIHKKRYQGYPGQSLFEYTMIILLVVFLAFGSLITIGRNISEGLKDMLPAPEHALDKDKGLNGVRLGNPAISGASNLSPTVTSLSLQDYSTNLAKLVQTTGVNGSTMGLSSQLSAVAQTLLESGTVSTDEANQLTALANQGMRMALLEAQLEEASQKSTSNEAFLNSPINFNGQTYLVKDAGNLIGFSSPNSPDADMLTNGNYMMSTSSAQPETLAFLNLYNQVAAIPELQNTETLAIVQKLSAQVSYLSDVASNQVNGAYNSSVSLDTLKQQSISSATVFDSESIYREGQDL